jgi:hypothetical protein
VSIDSCDPRARVRGSQLSTPTTESTTAAKRRRYGRADRTTALGAEGRRRAHVGLVEVGRACCAAANDEVEDREDVILGKDQPTARAA